MAEAPAARPGALGAITRKAGPLPVWAWAAVVLVGYLAYKHLKGSSATSAQAPDTTQTDQNTYVPGFDAAGAGGGGGIGDTTLPQTIYNYYYPPGSSPPPPDPNGGGSTGGNSGGGNSGGGVVSGVPISHYAEVGRAGLPAPGVAGGSPPSQFQVPVRTQIGAGGSRASHVAGLV